MEECVFVTGGAGFIGSNFVLQTVAAGVPVVNLDKLTYAGNPENLATLAGNPLYTFVHGDICDAALVASLSCGAPALGHHPLRRRIPRRPLHHRPRRLPAHQHRRHLSLLQAARAYHATLSATKRASPARISASSTSPPTRSTARSRPPTPPSTKRRPTRPTRPTPRPKPHPTTSSAPGTTPTACPRWSPTAATTTALPVSRKADPADAEQRPPGQAAAGLRRRPAGPRLAVRARPLCRHPQPSWPARAEWARPTTSAAATSAPTWTWSTPSARCSTNFAPTRPTSRTHQADPVRARSSRPRSPLRHRRLASSIPNSAWRAAGIL